MELIDSQKEAAGAIDDSTKEALALAREEARIHGTVTPEQSRLNAREQYDARQDSRSGKISPA